jgi:hypothetical protein
MLAIYYVLFWVLVLVAVLVPVVLSKPLFQWANRLSPKADRQAKRQAWFVQVVT